MTSATVNHSREPKLIRVHGGLRVGSITVTRNRRVPLSGADRHGEELRFAKAPAREEPPPQASLNSATPRHAKPGTLLGQNLAALRPRGSQGAERSTGMVPTGCAGPGQGPGPLGLLQDRDSESHTGKAASSWAISRGTVILESAPLELEYSTRRSAGGGRSWPGWHRCQCHWQPEPEWRAPVDLSTVTDSSRIVNLVLWIAS